MSPATNAPSARDRPNTADDRKAASSAVANTDSRNSSGDPSRLTVRNSHGRRRADERQPRLGEPRTNPLERGEQEPNVLPRIVGAPDEDELRARETPFPFGIAEGRKARGIDRDGNDANPLRRDACGRGK